MFKYSSDYGNAYNQRLRDDDIMIELSKDFNLHHSNKLNSLLIDCPELGKINFLKDFHAAYQSKGKFRIVALHRDITIPMVYPPVRGAFDALSKSIDDWIPYIEYSSDEMQSNEYSEFKEYFLIFLSEHSTFEESENYFLTYLNKMKDLKAFI